MFAVIGAIGLIGRVGNDQEHRYFNIQNKRMIMIRIGVSVICGCSSFVSQRVTKLSKLFEFIIITRKGFNFVCVCFFALPFLLEIVFTTWIKDYMFFKMRNK
jgi:hypothetical protein